MWQKCPICHGEGRVTGNGTTSSVHQVCPTCNGARIISELNGLPPSPKKIELTSDEEIDNASLIVASDRIEFIKGAKYVINKIQGGNK